MLSILFVSVGILHMWTPIQICLWGSLWPRRILGLSLFRIIPLGSVFMEAFPFICEAPGLLSLQALQPFLCAPECWESELWLRNALRCKSHSFSTHTHTHWKEPSCYIWLAPNGPKVWAVCYWSKDLAHSNKEKQSPFCKAVCSDVVLINHILLLVELSPLFIC